MTERQSAEKQLVRIAHTLKSMGYKTKTKEYHSFVYRQKLNFLNGQTTATALRNGKRERVLGELTDLANDSFS